MFEFKMDPDTGYFILCVHVGFVVYFNLVMCDGKTPTLHTTVDWGGYASVSLACYVKRVEWKPVGFSNGTGETIANSQYIDYENSGVFK